MVAGIGNVTPDTHKGVWQRSKAGGPSLPSSQGELRGELQFEALMRMLDNKVIMNESVVKNRGSL